MRVVAGRHRGKRLIAPSDHGIRPTADRTREALFNLLAHGPYATAHGQVPIGLAVLDAFAGTGALGLEALSRGAARASFIELDAAACRLIERNAQAMGESERISVFRRDATDPGPAPRPHELALLDPPYRSGLAVPALAALAAAGWLAADAVVVVETEAKEPPLAPPPSFEIMDERRYGAARLSILRYRGR